MLPKFSGKHTRPRRELRPRHRGLPSIPSRIRTRFSPVLVAITVLIGGLVGPASAYMIHSGDTVRHIAATHNRSVRCIVRANHLSNPDLIVAGKHLVVYRCRRHRRRHHHTHRHANARLTSYHSGGLRAYAHRLVGNQYHALAAIISRESGWNVHATNPSSGAYGIPQALPGSKMASAGPNWRNDGYTQIRWMIRYCRSTYGSVSGAWAFWRAHGWY